MNVHSKCFSDDCFHVRQVRRGAGLTCALVFLVVWGAVGGFPRAGAQALSGAEQTEWQQRLVSVMPNSVDGARTMQALHNLPPDTSLALLKDAWQKIASAETRLYVLNMSQDHPRVLELLDLGVKDTSLYVQNRAIQALEMYSFENYAEDFGAYDAWRQKQAGRSLEETMRESCREYVQSVQKADDGTRFQRLTLLQRVAYNVGAASHSRLRRKAMLESGLPDALAEWLNSPTTAWMAFAVLRNLKMDEAYLRRVVVPRIGPDVELNFRRQALGVLATPDNRWAADILLKMFVKEYPDPESENVGYALTQMGDPRLLPTLIAMIGADNSPDGQRILGNILNLMTGNGSGLLHDGAWWRTWWTRNAARFPADVRALPIPQIAVRQRPANPGAVQGPEQHQIAGDFKRTYWLVSPTRLLRGRPVAAGAPPANLAVRAVTEEEAPGLLVVLPPDGNGANAALFWHSLEQKTLKNRYLVAVAVAPNWSQTQPATWLTVDSVKQVKEAKFSTEKFAAEIVQDVLASHTVDRNRIFLHGAADSGLAVYACSLDEATPFKGFYVLASPFKSANLPPLSRAKNRRYLIQHSSDDKTAPFILAAAAQKILAEQGAVAKLEPYKGAHGYVFANPNADPIGDAIAWLEGSRK